MMTAFYIDSSFVYEKSNHVKIGVLSKPFFSRLGACHISQNLCVNLHHLDTKIIPYTFVYNRANI